MSDTFKLVEFVDNKIEIIFKEKTGVSRHQSWSYFVEPDRAAPISIFTPRSGVLPFFPETIEVRLDDISEINYDSLSIEIGQIDQLQTLSPSFYEINTQTNLLKLHLNDNSLSLDLSKSLIIKVIVEDEFKNLSQNFAVYKNSTSDLSLLYPQEGLLNNDAPRIAYRYDSSSALNESSIKAFINGKELPKEIVKVLPGFGIEISLNQDNAFTRNQINYLQVLSEDELGNSHSIVTQYIIPKVQLTLDVTSPQVSYFPLSNSFIAPETQEIAISFFDDSLINFDRLQLRLNGDLIAPNLYRIDNINNKVFIPINQSLPFLPDQTNVFSVQVFDQFANRTESNAFYTYNQELFIDTSGPRIKFIPEGGLIDLLSVDFKMLFEDVSGLDQSSFKVLLDNKDITDDFTLYTDLLQATSSFRRNNLFSTNSFSILEVSIKDNLGNETISKIGFDTRNVNSSNQVNLISLGSNSSSGDTNVNCVLLTEGEVKCFGASHNFPPSNGILGRGDTSTTIGVDRLPSEVSPISLGEKAKKIAISQTSVCALLVSGNVRCWGDNYAYFQTKDDTSIPTLTARIGDDEKPSDIPVVDFGGNKVADLFGYHSKMCVLLENGEIVCWGDGIEPHSSSGHHENIGDDEDVYPNGIVFQKEDQVISMMGNAQRECALYKSGKAKCWGTPFFGALGYGMTIIPDSEVMTKIIYRPEDAPFFDVPEKIVEISMGQSSTCFLFESKRVKCFGGLEGYLDSNGEFILSPIAIGLIGLSQTEFSTLLKSKDIIYINDMDFLDLGGDVKSIKSSRYSTCALLQNGKMKCWGWNPYGNLGLGIPEESLDKNVSEIPYVNIGETVEKIIVNSFNTCAILAEGKMKCWGNRFGGGDGLGSDYGTYTPNLGDEPHEQPVFLPYLSLGSKVEYGEGSDSSDLKAEFSISKESGEVPLTIDFDGSSSFTNNNIVNYAWQFEENGDIVNTTTPSIQTTYESLGHKTIRLTITDNLGNTSFYERLVNATEKNFHPVSKVETLYSSHIRPGDSVSIRSSSFDPDGTIETYHIDFGDGTSSTENYFFGITKQYDKIGDYIVRLKVTDDKGASSESTLVVYVRPITTLSGRVLDAVAAVEGRVVPLSGVRVSILGTSSSSVTDSRGFFSIYNITKVENSILDFDSTNATSSEDKKYASFRERFKLDEGKNIVIDRPFYLPPIETDSLTKVDPTKTTIVRNDDLGIELKVNPNSAFTVEGKPFTGELSISRVPSDLAPAQFPPFFRPANLITIQPVGTIFDPPAEISFNNVDNLPPGAETNIWSVSPDTGEFIIVAKGRVSTNALRIETIPGTGGIVQADWHMTIPPKDEELNPPEREREYEKNDDGCGSRRKSGSDTKICTGELRITHSLPSYKSMNRDNTFSLEYGHQKSYPTKVLSFNFNKINSGATAKSVSIFGTFNGITPQEICNVVGNKVVCSTPVLTQGIPFIGNTTDLTSHENIPSFQYRQAAYVDVSSLPTGLYPYDLLVENSYTATKVRTIQRDQVMINNRLGSIFGNGWSLFGLDKILQDQSNGIILVEGNEEMLHFKKASTKNTLTMEMYAIDNPSTNLENLTFSGFAGLQKSNFSVREPKDNNLKSVSSHQISNIDFSRRSLTTSIHHGRNGLNDSWNNQTIVDDDTEIMAPDNSKFYGASFKGYIKIPEAGIVTFRITKSKYHLAKLFINGESVIQSTSLPNSSGLHTVDNNIVLPEGLNQIELYYSTKSDDRIFKLSASGGGLGTNLDEAIPSKFLFNSSIIEEDAEVFKSPSGDFSSLSKLPNGTIERVYKNGSIDQFTNLLLSKRIDKNGNIKTYLYNSSNNISQIKDEAGLITSFDYLNDLVSKITLPSGREIKLEHDQNRNLVKIIDPDNSLREFTYDNKNRIISQKMKNGSSHSYVYNFANQNIKATRGDGSEWKFKATELNALAPESGPSLQLTEIKDIQAEYIDGNNNVTRYKTNPRGIITTTINPLDQTTSKTLDQNNRLTQSIDAKGNITNYTLDSNGNTVKVISSDGAEIQTTYHSKWNLPTKIISPLGKTTGLNYNNKGDLISITRPNGDQTQFSYNEKGLLTTTLLPNGSISELLYDTKFNLLERKNAVGDIIKFERNEFGAITKTIDGKGNPTSYTYDILGRQTSTTDAKGDKTLFTYDLSGNNTSVTDASLNKTSFEFDSENRVVKTIDQNSFFETYTYDNNSNNITFTNKNGHLITNTFNQIDLLVGRQSTGLTNYFYDVNQNLTYIKNEQSKITLSYNQLDRLIAVSNEGEAPTTQLSYQYDLDGNQILLSTEYGNITKEYDQNSRISNLIGFDSEYTFEYQNGYRKRITYPNGISKNIITDQVGRIQSMKDSILSTILTSLGLAYDKNSNIIQKDTLLGQNSYSYDSVNQVTANTNTSGSKIFTYDPTGNRSGTNHETTTNNQLKSDKNHTYTHDKNGNITQSQNKATGEIINYIFDRDNKLLEIHKLPSPSASPILKVRYVYDGLDRRIAKYIDDQKISYIYDGENILFEYNEQNILTAKYTHGLNTDEHLGFERDSSKYFFHTDHLGSTVAISNQAGEVIQKHSYSTFGEMKVFDKDNNLMPKESQLKVTYGFTGREIDYESSLFYYRARFYSPSTGRFISSDPIGFAGGDLNLYRYVNNNPVNRTDPSGLKPKRGTIDDFKEKKNLIEKIRNLLTCKVMGNCEKETENADKNVFDYIKDNFTPKSDNKDDSVKKSCNPRSQG